MRKGLFITLCCLMFGGVHAMDVAPFKAGQTLTPEQARAMMQRYAQRPEQAWKEVGTASAIKGHKDEDLIRYGIQVLDQTVQTIGPMAGDADKRYSGNGLNCSSCHLKNQGGLPGTAYDAIPFVNVANDYPNFRARSMTIGTAADRVNGCMTRSMGDGRPMPLDSREMQGILAYFDWLAEGTKHNQAMAGTGLPGVNLPDRQASPESGKTIFKQSCVQCHGMNAQGLKAPRGSGAPYTFPPLAGDDSFNDGAGMSRLIKATRFIHANMPLGATSKNPTLTVDQAYDVAAYVLSLPRPERPGRENDFPDPEFRPADYPVPAYFKGDKQALQRAKLGPYPED
jgi:thiosulfate dehydrogenase